MIAKLAIDPRDPNIVYAASMGHVFKPNAERGIFKTTNGGATWRKVLYVDEKTGGIDLVHGSAITPTCFTPRCGRRSDSPGS